MAQEASQVAELHAAVKRGDLPAMRRLLESNPALANARSQTDPRGTFPLHVAAEAGQAGAARLLLEYGADVSARTAAPVVGGLWSCMVLTLLVLPAAYSMWRRQQVRVQLAATVPNVTEVTTGGVV